MGTIGHVTALAGGAGGTACRAVEGAMSRGLPHLPLGVVRSHVAFGADLRVPDNLQLGAMVGMARGAGTLYFVATIAPRLPHIAALLQKAGALHLRFRNLASRLMTESALFRIAVRQASCASPTGMEPHAVTAGLMLEKRLAVATAANFHVNPCFSLIDTRMVGTMTSGATDTCPGVSTLFPLPHGCGSLLPMTGETIVCR